MKTKNSYALQCNGIQPETDPPPPPAPPEAALPEMRLGRRRLLESTTRRDTDVEDTPTSLRGKRVKKWIRKHKDTEVEGTRPAH